MVVSGGHFLFSLGKYLEACSIGVNLTPMTSIVIVGSTRVPRVATAQRGVVLADFQLS